MAEVRTRPFPKDFFTRRVCRVSELRITNTKQTRGTSVSSHACLLGFLPYHHCPTSPCSSHCSMYRALFFLPPLLHLSQYCALLLLGVMITFLISITLFPGWIGRALPTHVDHRIEGV